MLALEDILAGFILLSLTLYALLGGADYGAGIWYLFAKGPEGHNQRELISTAIGPIWEANHVWLILALTLLFSAFPGAFARMTTLLHIPMTLLLIGIVFRGSAYAFRNYDIRQSPIHRVWGMIFGSSSVMTALLLGIILGTVASTNLQYHPGDFFEVFVQTWIQPFPLIVGIWTMTLFALLASIYLIHDTPLPVLRELFRIRALWTMLASVLLALLVLLLTHQEVPEIFENFSQSPEGWVFLTFATLAVILTAIALWTRRFQLARISVVGYVTAILWGWGWSHYPLLIKPDLTVYNAAAPDSTLTFLLFVLVIGMVIVFPSLIYLLRIFKKIPI